MPPFSSANSLERRFAALLIEQAPFAVENALRAFESARDAIGDEGSPQEIEALRPVLKRKL